eukprot:Gb_22317 [translate_table: standard]
MISALTLISFGWSGRGSGLVRHSHDKQPKFGMNIPHQESSQAKWLCHLTSEIPALSCKLGVRKTILTFATRGSIRGSSFSCSKNPSQKVNAKIAATGADRTYFGVNDDLDIEPFWLWLVKELLSGLKSALLFLWEQPGQLKYIEWPSFQSTLKTATLTLLLVILLIILLSSVDSASSYLLVSLLRRKS